MEKKVMKFFLFLVLVLCGDIFAVATKHLDVVDKYSYCSLQQHADVIKDYVSTAKLCGYSDEQILENFLNEAEKLEENNGILTLSLEYDRKTVYWTVGIVGTVGLAALVCTIYYYVTKASEASTNSGASVALLGQRPILRGIANDGAVDVTREVLHNELGGDLGFIGRQMNGDVDGAVDVTRVVLPPARRSIRERKQTDFYISHDNRFVN